jgi:hypothetical protein
MGLIIAPGLPFTANRSRELNMATHNRYQQEANLGGYLGKHLADIQTPSPIAAPRKREARLDRRFRVNEMASVISSDFSGPAKILDVSKNGLGIAVAHALHLGLIIQVALPHGFVLGEVRHCNSDGSRFRAGILIKDVLRSQYPISRKAALGVTPLAASHSLPG